MKPSAAEYILSYLGSALILAGAFHKPLGLPEYSDIIFFLAAGVCLIFFWRVQRRRKSQPNTEPDGACSGSNLQRLWENKSKRVWLMIAMFGILCVGSAFVGPYTVENLCVFAVRDQQRHYFYHRRGARIIRVAKATAMRSNQTLERTADRRESLLSMTSTEKY